MPEIESGNSDLTIREALAIYEAVQGLRAVFSGKRRAAVMRLIEIGAPAVSYLIEELGSRQVVDREAIIEVLVGIGKPAVGPLTQALLSPDRRVYEDARCALQKIDMTAAVEAMRELLHQEITAAPLRKKQWRLRILRRLGIRLTALALFIWLCNVLPLLQHFGVFLAQVCVCGIMGSFVDTTINMRRNAIDLLGFAEDVRMVGPLALYLSDASPAVRNAAANALKKLLPRVQASDRPYIATSEMEALLKALSGKDCLLTTAILKALEQIGDAKALPRVEKLAKDSSKPFEVRHAAEACLPFLQERARQAEQAQTLLRAASAAPPSGETLLRPASGASSPVEADQLLRPHAGRR